MLTRIVVLTSTVLCFGLLAAAQQGAPRPVTRGGPPVAHQQLPGGAANPTPPAEDPIRGIQQRINQATARLRDADDSDTRDAARSDLHAALADDYDLRLDEYEKQLDRMEKHLAEMRSKLARKRQAKSDMVQLRLQLLEAEADDLGWPGSATPAYFTELNVPAPDRGFFQRFGYESQIPNNEPNANRTFPYRPR